MAIINMLCQYCNYQAELRCRCFSIFCTFHCLTHARICKQHSLDGIDDNFKSIFFPIELVKKVQKIDEIHYKIVAKTEEIIKKINNLCDKSLNRLKILKEKYMKVLQEGNLQDLETEFGKEMIAYKTTSPNLNSIKKYYDKILQ